MPNTDGTGPEGKGSKTGRQLGNCEGRRKGDCPKGRERKMTSGFELRRESKKSNE